MGWDNAGVAGELAAATRKLRRRATSVPRRIRVRRRQGGTRLRFADRAGMNTIPWSFTARPDTRTTNVRLGMWLFLASAAMLFGSLFSGYVLLPSGVSQWPSSSVLSLRHALLMPPVLLAATIVLSFKRAPNDRARLIGSSVLFSAFVGMKVLDYAEKIAAGLMPSTNLLLGCWFTLTAVHAVHVAAGVMANLWVAFRLDTNVERNRERFGALRLYWYFVDLVWVAILVSFYLV